jgi:hypothetical protein
MIRRNTIILLFVLIVLIGFSYYWKNKKNTEAAKATPTTTTAVLFSSSEGSPSDIKISDSSGQTVEVKRSTTGTWEMQTPVVAAADQGFVEAAASQIGALRIIDNVQLGPDVVGLDKPTFTINISFTGGKEHKLLVGSVTPIQNGYYIQLDSLQVQIIDKQGLDAILGLLTNPPYAETLTPLVSDTPTTLPETPTPEATFTPPAASITGTPSKSP